MVANPNANISKLLDVPVAANVVAPKTCGLLFELDPLELLFEDPLDPLLLLSLEPPVDGVADGDGETVGDGLD